jgi:hypothetical protein
MKRRLVIYNEACRHPFRQELPPAVLAVSATEMAALAKPQATTAESVRLFLASFAAAFLAIFTFIL